MGPQRRDKDSDQFRELFDVGLHALAKRSLFNKYEIANEVISCRLGQALGLPVPVGVPLAHKDQEFYSSMIFAGSGQNLPPADTQLLAAYDTRIACGITVFDCWICNGDRNEKNVSFNEATKEIRIFDHGVALFGTEGSDRFVRIGTSHAFVIDRYNHSIAMEFTSLIHFDEWERRVLELPQYLIADACEEATEFGISKDDAGVCKALLLDRRMRLREMFFDRQNDHDFFPSVPKLFRSITSRGDDYIEYYL
jgi:hypothetical protein